MVGWFNGLWDSGELRGQILFLKIEICKMLLVDPPFEFVCKKNCMLHAYDICFVALKHPRIISNELYYAFCLSLGNPN